KPDLPFKKKLRTAVVRGADQRQPQSAHVPEKWVAVFRKGHAQILKTHGNATRVSVQYRSKKLCLVGVDVVARFLLAGENLFADAAGILPDRGFDLRHHVGVRFQEGLGVLAALADALAVVGEPGTRLLDHTSLDAEVQNFSGLGDTLAIHDV